MLHSILTYGGTCLPNSMYSNGLAHAAVPFQAFHNSIIYLPRWCSEEALWRNRLEAFHYSITCLSRWPSREALERNCPDTTKLTTCQPNGWVAWTASSCHLSRVSPVLNIPEVPPQTSTLKPIFRRHRYEEHVLPRTRREAISDTTLSSNF